MAGNATVRGYFWRVALLANLNSREILDFGPIERLVDRIRGSRELFNGNLLVAVQASNLNDVCPVIELCAVQNPLVFLHPRDSGIAYEVTAPAGL